MRDERDFDASTDGGLLAAGTAVYDANGAKLGTLARVRDGALVVRRGLVFARAIVVPLAAVRRADADGVHLRLTRDQVRDATWHPLHAPTPVSSAPPGAPTPAPSKVTDPSEASGATPASATVLPAAGIAPAAGDAATDVADGGDGPAHLHEGAAG